MNDSVIRVAMIIQAYHPHVGGAERQLMALVPLLQDHGVEVHILTRRYPGLKPYEVIGGAPVHRLPIPGPKPVASLFFTLAALPLLRRLRPHVLHAHELLSPTTTAVAAKRLFSVPIVAKVLSGGKQGDVDKLQHKPFGQKRLTTFRHQVDAFITISQEIDEELAAIDIPVEKRVFIPNGVDTDRFSPASLQAKQALRTQLRLPVGPIALFMGRLVPQKGLDQLINIWPEVLATHPQATLLIVGTGEKEAALRQMAGANIHFAGRIDDVIPYLQTADLFILPSSHEGLSNALLEAMVSGLPSIATNVGGAPDVIVHDERGWLVPTKDQDSLRDAIILLLADNKRRAKFSLLGRDYILQNYSLPLTAKRLVNLYRRVQQPHLKLGESL